MASARATAAAAAAATRPVTVSPEPRLLTPEAAYYSSPPRERGGARGTGGIGNNGGGNINNMNGRDVPNSSGSYVASSPRAQRSMDQLRSSASTSSLASAAARARYSHTNSGLRAPGNADDNGGDDSGIGARSRSRRRRDASRAASVASAAGGRAGGGVGGKWKKLLWIKQPYPDNYTDPSTFLLQMQWVPVRAYDFWPLVADSTVIVQHVCAVALFVCCFVGIYQERISPVSVVGTATACSFAGWVLWDIWLGRDEREKEKERERERERERAILNAVGNGTFETNNHNNGASTGIVAGSSVKANGTSLQGTDGELSIGSNNVGIAGLISTSNGVGTSGLGISGASMPSSKVGSRNQSSTSLAAYYGATPASTGSSSTPASYSSLPTYPQYQAANSLLSTRNQQRLATAKSALLIYLALLGLSPILKSLTMSTTSDSIWAMSCWLLLTNIFTFDYGGSSSAASSGASSPSPSTRFPASLSTNAALMASTVLASRLPSTTHVFSLTLFSIEVFGLFPVFRRHLRHRSFALHVALTVLLILGSGAGLGVTLIGGGGNSSGGGDGASAGAADMGALPIKAAAIGAAIWGLIALTTMGGCSWWLIGLQRYKNVVIGPWDPARPVIRAGAWD